MYTTSVSIQIYTKYVCLIWVGCYVIYYRTLNNLMTSSQFAVKRRRKDEYLTNYCYRLCRNAVTCKVNLNAFRWELFCRKVSWKQRDLYLYIFVRELLLLRQQSITQFEYSLIIHLQIYRIQIESINEWSFC